MQMESPMASYLLHSIPEAHFPGGLSADLGFCRIQIEVEVCHALELGVVFLTGVYKVLDFCHRELSERTIEGTKVAG